MRRLASAPATAGLLAGIAWACSGGSSSSVPPAAATATVASLTVTGTPPQVGSSAQFNAMATMSTLGTQVVTSQAAWQSSSSAVATVTGSGVVTGVAPGTVDITATYQNVSGIARITITAPQPTTFTVTGTVTDATSGVPLAGAAVA